MQHLSKNTVLISIIGATTVSVVFVTLITILGEIVKVTVDGESAKVIKDFLKEQHHHHWVGKGIWTMFIFAATALLGIVVMGKKEVSEDKLARYTSILTWTIAAGAIILLVFFGYEYAIHH